MLGHLGNVLGLDEVGGVHKGWWSRTDGCHNGPKLGLLKKQGQVITTNASEQVKVEQVQCLK